jgi:hypothetical protein
MLPEPPAVKLVEGQRVGGLSSHGEILDCEGKVNEQQSFQAEKPSNNSLNGVKRYGGIGCAIGSGLNPVPPNNGINPT